MEVGKVKIAEDSDFLMLKQLIDEDTNWKLEYDKGIDIKVRSCINFVFFFFFNIHIYFRIYLPVQFIGTIRNRLRYRNNNNNKKWIKFNICLLIRLLLLKKNLPS